MNTIKKLSVEINKLDGLKICKLENSKERENALYTADEYKNDLSAYAEHDRVFNNVDIVQDMLIDVMEQPRTIETLHTNADCFIPMTSYEEKINLYEDYDNKLTRWLNETNA